MPSNDEFKAELDLTRDALALKSDAIIALVKVLVDKIGSGSSGPLSQENMDELKQIHASVDAIVTSDPTTGEPAPAV